MVGQKMLDLNIEEAFSWEMFVNCEKDIHNLKVNVLLPHPLHTNRYFVVKNVFVI